MTRRHAARRGAARALGVLLLGVLGVGGRSARAQDLTCQAGDREVRSLNFVGNRAFSDLELSRVVVTTPSSAASRLRIIGTRRCLDPDEFPRDVIRLEAYYRKRGYVQATVDTTVRPVNGRARRVDVAFRITEGPPQRLDRLTISGMHGVRDSARMLRGVPVRAGDVFDRAGLEAFRDTIVQRLHNGGYLRADALFSWSTIDSITARIDVQPGPFTRIGAVTVRFDTTGGATPRIPESVVRRTIGVRPGDVYSAADIIAAQRALYQTDAYRRVEVRVDTVGQPDSLVTLEVGLQEGDLHVMRLAAGWATLDCFRTQADYSDRYFLPFAQHLDLQARLSKIGKGEPLGFAPDLCPQAKSDPFSDKVNYYFGATVGQPTFFRLNRVPTLTLFSSRTSEYKAYRRATTVGALFSLASRTGSRLPSTLTYQFEIGRTEADPALFCVVFSACTAAARDALSGNRPIGALGYTIVRDRTDDPLAPTRGSLQRFNIRHSSMFTGSDVTQRFTKAVTDASWYWHVGGESNVLLAHVQLGSLLGQERQRAPQQERLYAGGPTSVRGFRQNELGPAVYLFLTPKFDTVRVSGDTVYFRGPESTRADRTIPTGGNSLVVGNLELQLRSPVLPDLLQLALFTDAGEVWDRGSTTAAFRGLRVTPGAGVRVHSLFGVIRVDLGYNPYALRAGPAFFVNSTQGLYCVSPTNTIPVTNLAAELPTEGPGACPATFQPAAERGFLKRLNPSIWIGNAF